MAEYALGWLGWSEDQTLDTDVNAIFVAVNGRVKMFEFIGLAQPDTTKTVSDKPLSPSIFDTITRSVH